MKRVQILSGLAGLAVVAAGSSALAERSLYPLPPSQREPADQPYADQRPPEGNFDRDRNISVRERDRPQYKAGGVQLGGGMALYPKLTVGAEHDDNVYAVPTNAVEDTVYTVQPELILQAGSGDTQLEAFARAGRRMNDDYPKESTTDYQVGGSGAYVTSGIRLTGGGDYGRYTEPRTSPTAPINTAKPVRYKLGQANIGASYTMDRLRVTGGVELQDYDFKDGRDAAGAQVEQDDRDRRIMTYTAKAEYALTPNTSVFLVSAFDDRRYDRRPPTAALNRDSQGIDVAVGTSFDISALARGEIQLGYVKQDYDALVDIKGLTGKVNFEWFPTELTTVSLTGSRDVRDATVPGAGGFLSGNYGVQVDQELLDNLILTARGGYGLDTYKGIDREDKRTSGYLGANYLLSRNLGFALAYDYLKQKSSGAAPGQSFEDNRVSLSSSLQF